ncbi:MAG TPA: LysM peptidoglycan-binding domain-containing protein [Draconibacterium sp.]|nr:LysM peptidoglycan-binding domain-containing protein [Draconibacterium sp.]
MKIFQVIVFFSFLIFCDVQASAQQLKENEIVVIHGEKFVLHQVRTGETLFSISKKYNVDGDDLVGNNPKIKNEGVKIGEILKIPYKENADLSQTPVYKKGDPTRFEYYTITSRNETPYFIAKKYGITVEEIYAYNPKVRRFRKGTKLRIPIWNVQPDEQSNVPETKQEIAKETPEELQKPVTNDKLLVHTVVSGETLFSISQQYQIPVNEILKYNPGMRRLRAGAQIYLPKKEAFTTAIPEKNIAPETTTNYFEHIIESGETMWGITRRYDVTEAELKALNPVLETSFPAGVVIKIPLSDVTEVKATPLNNDAFINHYVEKGETLYGLAEKYNLTIPEIKKYNPALNDRNLIYGETILIPRKPEPEKMEPISQTKVEQTEPVQPPKEFYKVEIPREIPESCRPDETGLFTANTYTIALFLPLFLEENDTLNKVMPILPESDSLLVADTIEEQEPLDTLVEEVVPEDKFVRFYGNTENFLQFYEGVMLAVDSMKNAGMNIQLNVYDTERNADSIRQFIYSSDFLETDLIIGPVYPNVQNEVADIAAKNHIPIISPLASQSNELNGNPYYFQVNPDRNYLAVKTAELIADEYFNSNFVVVKTSNYAGTPEGRIVNLIQEKLYNSGLLNQPNGVTFSVYDFENEGPFGLRRILSHSKENVIYIPSSNEGEISVAVSNIFNLVDDYSITLIGSNRYQQYKSIEIEKFHDLKLKFIAPYWVDYQKPSTIDYIEKFKSNFYTEPDNFGMQGYDVTFYFLNAFKNYGTGFEDCLPYMQVDLMQGNYNFEKVSAFGGYMNEGVSVISYKSNYDVVRERAEGQPNLAAH